MWLFIPLLPSWLQFRFNMLLYSPFQYYRTFWWGVYGFWFLIKLHMIERYRFTYFYTKSNGVRISLEKTLIFYFSKNHILCVFSFCQGLIWTPASLIVTLPVHNDFLWQELSLFWRRIWISRHLPCPVLSFLADYKGTKGNKLDPPKVIRATVRPVLGIW